MRTKVKSTTEHTNTGSGLEGHIVLGGQETDREMLDGKNVVQFDLNEETAVMRSGFRFPLLETPYVNEAPVDILERWRPLSTGTLTGETVAIIAPFTSLLDDATVKAAIQSFEFLRSDFEVRITFVTTVFNFGLAFISDASLMSFLSTTSGFRSWVQTTGAAGEKYDRIINNDALVVDLSQQEEVTLSIGWPFPFSYLPLRTYYNNIYPGSSTTNSVRLAICLPLGVGRLDTSNPDNVAYNIWVRFKNPVLQGQCLNCTTVEPPSFDRRNRVDDSISGQMSGIASVGALGVAGGIAGKGIYDLGSEIVTGFLKKKGNEAFEQGVGKVKSKFGLDSETTQEEANTYDDSNMQTSVWNDMWGEVSGRTPVRRIPLPGAQSPVSRKHRISDYIGVPSICKSIAWGGSGFVFDTWPIGATSDREIRCDRLTWVSRFYRYWRGDVTYTFVFACSPLLSTRIAYTVGWNDTESIAASSPNNQKRVITVRGTTVVPITIPFLAQTPWLPCSDGDGDDYELPARRETLMYPKIWFENIAPFAQLGDVPALIHLYAFKRAESNFKFYSLRQASVTYQGGGSRVIDDHIEAQMYLSEMCQSQVPIQMGTSSPDPGRECGEFLEDVCSRYSLSNELSGFAQPYEMVFPWPAHSTTASLGGASNMQSMCGIFLYYRGSFDWKIGLDFSEPENLVLVVADNGCDVSGLDTSKPLDPELVVSNGQARVDPRFTSVLDVKASVQGVLDWWPTIPETSEAFPAGYLTGGLAFTTAGLVNYYLVNQDGIDVVPISALHRAGDDIGFAYILPPPNISYWPSISVDEFKSSARDKTKSSRSSSRGSKPPVHRKSVQLPIKPVKAPLFEGALGTDHL